MKKSKIVNNDELHANLNGHKDEVNSVRFHLNNVEKGKNRLMDRR